MQVLSEPRLRHHLAFTALMVGVVILLVALWVGIIWAVWRVL